MPGMASAFPQHVSNNQNGNVDGQTTSWMMHHNVNENPSRETEQKQNGQDTTCEPALLSDASGEKNTPHASNSSEMLISEEYQAYLQDSLAKFMQNMRIH